MSAEGNGYEPLLSPIDTSSDVLPDVTLDDLGGFSSFADQDLALAVSDLIQDSNGEVVFLNEGGSIRSLALDAEAPVVDQGLSEQHVTAGGDDVSGFKYIEFADGLTLYFDPSLDVIVKTGEV